MSAPPRSVRDLVHALGGPTCVGHTLGLSCEAICMWYRGDRVPKQHHLAVWQMARAKGIAWQPPGTEGMTLAPAPPPRQAAA